MAAPRQKPAQVAAIAEFKGNVAVLIAALLQPGFLLCNRPGYSGLLERQRATRWLKKTDETLRSLLL